jgi:hypothetical protein
MRYTQKHPQHSYLKRDVYYFIRNKEYTDTTGAKELKKYKRV